MKSTSSTSRSGSIPRIRKTARGALLTPPHPAADAMVCGGMLRWWIRNLLVLLMISTSRHSIVQAQPPSPAPPPSVLSFDEATASCLIAMLGHNTDGNQYLNATEVQNWVLDVADGCLTLSDLMVASSSSLYASTRYAALVSQMACRCHEYIDATDAEAAGVVPCLPCVSSNTFGSVMPSEVVVALPGIYPVQEYPGSYAVHACDDIRAFLEDVCVEDSVTVPLPSPTTFDGSSGTTTTNTPTTAPALNIVDQDDTSGSESICLIALLSNNIDGDTVLNYAEFLHWMLDLSAGCWSVDDVVRQVHYGTFRDLACLCNNYAAPSLSSAPQCLSCSANLNNNNDPSRLTNSSGIALPGYYPPGEYPGGFAVAVCRQATQLVQDLCPTSNTTDDVLDTTTSMPTSSPVLGIVNAPPLPPTSTTGGTTNATAVEDRDVEDSTEEENSDDGMSRSEKLILGLVVPLGTLVVLVAAYGARGQLQQQQPQQRGGGRSFQKMDDNHPHVDEEVGATKSWKEPIQEDASVTENTTEDRTLPLSPESSQLYQQPSDSQTFDEHGAQLDLLVLPSDAKQQWDELHQTAPFTSSTMRVLQAAEEPLLPDDTARNVDRVDQVAAQDSTSAVHTQDNSDEKKEEDDLVGGIVATSVASSSSMKKIVSGRFSRRSNKKTLLDTNESNNPSDVPATVVVLPSSPSNADARTNSPLVEQEQFNPIFKLFSMGSTSTLQQQLDVMDHEENNREAHSGLSIGDSSGGGGISMIFTDDPEEENTPNTSLIANPPPEDELMAHTTTVSSTWNAPKLNESMGSAPPPHSPNHPDSSDNDEFLL